jgi:predicted Zn-dependent protease
MTEDMAYRLDPWENPLEILDSLVRLPRDRLSDVRDELHTLTKHDDADVRVHAIRRLFVHLKDMQFRADALSYFRADPHPEARRAAAFGIAATSTPETRRPDVEVLLQGLRDNDEQDWVRAAAYEALLLIHGRTDFPAANRDICLETDLDWEWINSMQ